MLLRSAFNALTRLHSRPATIKRLTTTVDLFSPIRVTPSNYFRFLRGPEYTTIKGREFIIPVSSILGQFSQSLIFENVPSLGTFKIKIGLLETTYLDFNSSNIQIQTALRLLSGLENVLVYGDFNIGFSIVFIGFSTSPELMSLKDSTLDSVGAFSNSFYPWSDEVQKGDRIILENNKQITIDEIIDMPDLGGTIMGWRVRCE